MNTPIWRADPLEADPNTQRLVVTSGSTPPTGRLQQVPGLQ